MTKVGWYALGKSTTLESNKSLGQLTAWGLAPHEMRGLAGGSPDTISPVGR